MTKLHQISKRKLLYSSIISIIFVLSMVTSVGLFATQNSTNTSTTSTLKTASSPPAINESWTGVGNNQTVRSYIEQDSNSTGDTNNFTVSVPTSPSQIYSGNMNFTFDQSHTTNYTFDQNSPLSSPKSSVRSNYQNFGDNYSIEKGSSSQSNTTGYLALTDTGSAGLGTALTINSALNSTNYMINFTYTGNFTSTAYVRNNTIGIKYNILKSISCTENVSLSVLAYNYYNLTWDLLKYYPVWNSTSSTTTSNLFITAPNTNCAYFNSNNMTRVKFELISTNTFTLNIYNFSVFALNGYDVKINNKSWAGIEFDLRGNATVYGFYAYIRTLTNNPQGFNLNVSLYYANQTANPGNVTSASLQVMQPNMSYASLINSYNFTGYSKDGYTFIPFYQDNSTGKNLTIGNYFVVLSTTANSTNSPYSILCLPQTPTNILYNLFLRSQDSGSSWAKQYYNYNQYEASPFAINLKRAWIPSDINMTIDNQTLSSLSYSTGIYTNSSPYQWGLGSWNHIFKSSVKDVNKIITVALDWNTTITPMLNFNITSYNITVFSIENASSTFNITLGQNPIWILNYTFIQSLYSPWIFRNFSFVVPSDWYYNSILNPGGQSIASSNITSSYSPSGTSNNFYTVSYAKTIKYSGNGLYQLNCTSFNYIENMTSYLHYNNDTWETRGFMPGDNISTAVMLYNYTGSSSIIKSGSANCFLYDPSNQSISGAYLTDSNPETNETIGTGNILTIYNFGGQNILNTTNSTPVGEYSLVYQWTNGNEIGYDRLPIYISDYQANITDMYVDNSSKTNVLLGLINNDYTNLLQYNATIFAINQTQGSASSSIPYVNDTLGSEYSDYMVNITSLTMNQSVISLGETIKLNITVASYNDFWSNNVKLGVQFVQSCNEKWIVMQQNSTQYTLNKTGAPNDTRIFQFTFQVPSNFTGINAPIRLNPLKIKITPWIDGINMSSFDVNDYFPLVNFNSSQFEGNVLGYTILGDHTGKSLVIENNRTYSILPGNTTYLMQVYDNNFVSTQNDVIKSFYSNLLSEITNVSSPDTIVWGKSYELTGYLQDEFGNPIANKSVDVQYLFNNTWNNYDQVSGTNSLITNGTGYFSGTFSSAVVPKSTNITVKTLWNGDTTHFGTNTNTTLYMSTYTNQVQITIVNATMYPSLYKGQGFEFVYQITNTGNSTLNDMNYSLNFPNTTITSEDLNASMVKQLLPGKSMIVGFYAEIPVVYPGNNVNITLYVNGTSIQSTEQFNSSKTYNFSLNDQNLFENWKEGLVIASILGIIVLFIATGWYIVKTRRKLQEVPELPSRTVKRGRYVKVSELQKAQPEKKQEEKVEETKEQKSADLDELLKEEGLDKDKSD